MKVRTLKLFNDLQSKKLRKANEIFEVSEKRLGEINSTSYGTLVEVIEEDKKTEVKNIKKSPRKVGGKNGFN